MEAALENAKTIFWIFCMISFVGVILINMGE